MPLIYGSHSNVLDHGRAWLDTMQAARRSATLYVIDGQQPRHPTGQEALVPYRCPLDLPHSAPHSSTTTLVIGMPRRRRAGPTLQHVRRRAVRAV